MPEEPVDSEMLKSFFGVSSFTTVGHLLHINLRDHLIQHKHEIGRLLLEKNPRALAVVNKVKTIDNTYRNFDIEVVAKRDDCEMSDEQLMICDVKENKCRFRLDFSKVYWNSRLGTEHERIVGKLNKEHDIVFDLFAGIGPFAVPAAKAKCLTYANDLNPECVKWLTFNMIWNKVPEYKYRIFNKDAKDFIRQDMPTKLAAIYKRLEQDKPEISPKIHILMNLPALAPTFLTHFDGMLNAHNEKTENPSLRELFARQSVEHTIYCYCFLKDRHDDPNAKVRSQIEEEFGRKLEDDQVIDIFRVRNVAPYKEMYRVEIRLDERILFRDSADNNT